MTVSRDVIWVGGGIKALKDRARDYFQPRKTQ